MADCGVASRRASERFIADGRCRVNGAVVTEAGVTIDPSADVVEVDGETVKPTGEHIYIMLHKPRGYVTTAKDQFNRPAVTDLVDVGARVYPVGRLDCDTSGLLLLTNDGDLAYRLSHPKFMVQKEYLAVLQGALTEEAKQSLMNGVDIGGYVTQPAGVEVVRSDVDRTDIVVTIAEGKNKQIRKMAEAVGFPVVRLKRIAIGRLRLGRLGEGEHRRLTPAEIKYLKTLYFPPIK